MKNIGIVCEGPTDFIILREVIDRIAGENHYYLQLQPEPDLSGRYGGGWKGVWKWCADYAGIYLQIMTEIEPQLDLLIIHMDGDVSRKERASHWSCSHTNCIYKGIRNPIDCDFTADGRKNCPVHLPCVDHEPSAAGYSNHLSGLIQEWLKSTERVCIVIPCDSIEASVIAAYDRSEHAEVIEDPWRNVIARKKSYHGIRTRQEQKNQLAFRQFAETVSENWEQVTQLCGCARKFEAEIRRLL